MKIQLDAWCNESCICCSLFTTEFNSRSAQLRVSRERPIAQAHPEAEISLRIRRMLHDDTRSIHYCVPHRLREVLRLDTACLLLCYYGPQWLLAQKGRPNSIN